MLKVYPVARKIDYWVVKVYLVARKFVRKRQIKMRGKELNWQQASEDVSTPGHGQGAGPAGYKFRVSGTQETVGGAGVSAANGVPTKLGCQSAPKRQKKCRLPRTFAEALKGFC